MDKDVGPLCWAPWYWGASAMWPGVLKKRRWGWIKRCYFSMYIYVYIYIICINLCIWVIGLHWILCKTTMLFSLTTENQTLFKNLGWKKGCDDHVVLQSYCVFHQLRQPRQLFSSSGQVGGSLKGLQPCNWAGSKCSRSTSESWSCLWIHGSFRGSTQRLWCGVVSWHTFKMVHSCFHMTDFFALEIS